MNQEFLQQEFRHFANVCEGYSPLYVALSTCVADEPWVLELASHGQARQPPSNLLFGAVQFLLLNGASHPLAAFYPSVGGREPAEDAWPIFVAFCEQFRAEIVELVRTRRVQTNEVGRCGVLLPAIAMAHQVLGRPLHLIEVGPSAGLNLQFDQFRYAYSNGHTLGPESRVIVSTELQGPHVNELGLPHDMPAVAARMGVDVQPVDVHDRDAMTWLEALIWPGDSVRTERFGAAVAIARAHPPRLLQGDARDHVPKMISKAESAHVPCVFHSNVIYQMNRRWRDDLFAMLDAHGRQRDMAHVSLEWLDADPASQLRMTLWRGGERFDGHLASAQAHGRWMAPLSSAAAFYASVMCS